MRKIKCGISCRFHGNLLAVLSAGLLLTNGCATNKSAIGGITDTEIRDVVSRVARHQIHPLADGDYVAAKLVEEAKSAKPPEGIAWNYPWGVTLFGMLRAGDAMDEQVFGKFVVEHNIICARYYAWLAGLKSNLTNSTELSKFTRDSKIKGLMALGSLDSCGAMGNEMLESMIRHPDQVTPDEIAVVARIADWVVNKQDRLPDGTLWRPKSMGGTLWPDDLYMGGVFLVRWGIYNHDQKFIEDSAKNIVHQAALEADTDGLWFHGFFVNEKKHAPFKWGRGNGWVTVTLVETISALPPDVAVQNSFTAAEILVSPSGKFVYATIRGHDSVSVFAADAQSGKLTFVQNISAGGKVPRGLGIDPTGRWLITANQKSDNAVEFAIDAKTGKLSPTGQELEIGSPVDVKFVR